MIEFFQHVIAFLFALGVLITFHEFGHFWVARKCDVKILRFSVGFGQPLWMRHFGKDKSEFVIAALPLGGYVKMLDEREGEVDPSELDRSFNRKPIGQRTAIVLAGPVFNFIFAILAYWLMFMIGLTGLRPVIGQVIPGSIAEQAGMNSNQEIIAVESRRTATWSMVVDALIDKVIDGEVVHITVRDNNEIEHELVVNLSSMSIDDLAESGLLKKMGVELKQVKVPAIIGSVQSGQAADRAGLRVGDQIIAVDGRAVVDWLSWVQFIQAHPDQELKVELMREKQLITLQLTPASKKVNDEKIIGFIGAGNQPPLNLFGKESYSLIPALIRAVERTWDMSWLTLRVLGKIVTGQASYKNLSGPISIAQYAGDSAQSGLAAFLWFLGIEFVTHPVTGWWTSNVLPYGVGKRESGI